MPEPHLVTVIKATCPECGMDCHFFEWEPAECWNCGESLKDYTPGILKAEDATWQVTVNPISGEPVLVK